MSSNSGRAITALIVAIMGLCLVAFCCVFAFNGCATPQDNKLMAARIIARHAGAHVAANNPALAKTVVVAYDSIQKATGEPYLVSVEAILSQMLMDEDVKNSDLLLADAKDLSALLNIPMPLSAEEVDMEWMRQFAPEAVRSVAEAFVGAMR